MIASLVIPMLLIIMRPAVLIFVQWMTFLGIIIWIKAGANYISMMDPNDNYFIIKHSFSFSQYRQYGRRFSESINAKQSF